MNYIIIDLEFNQALNTSGNEINYKLPFEIIQIGLIKLDDHFNTISTMNSLIKPEIYTTLNPYVEKLTGISMNDLSSSKSFKEVFNDLTKLFDDESVLCVWGVSDIKELYRNTLYHNLDVSLLPKLYINVQRHASNKLNLKKGMNIGLSSAAEIFEIPTCDNFHDAFYDALYTSEIFKKINSSNCGETPSSSFNKLISRYSYSNSRNTQPKTKLDKDRLFNQFEKMFSRELTYEEKSMIEFAYKMGKTSQFQIPVQNNKTK
ncbi:3'-5' exonuclease [Clostridium intestinale]|uniref:Exonuclease family protein n=1 Tax=Clostridium intestinale URNW TaxID=1294142 RepID=U2Q657_9CLOT|nr:3'-5' exonuclease [Clostridium intestinale]ERK31634.1 exonuclease family protein [Clostridium intestinale URNW]